MDIQFQAKRTLDGAVDITGFQPRLNSVFSLRGIATPQLKGSMPDRRDDLIEQARKLGHHRTKKEAVTAALVEYVNRRRRLEILSLFGKIEYDENYDYRQARKGPPPKP